MRGLLSRLGALAALLIVASPAAAVNLPLTGAGGVMGSVILAGDPLSLTITSSIWTTSSDLTPSTQFIDGFSGDLVLNATAPAGLTSAYGCTASTGVCGTVGSPKLSFPDVRPGYLLSGGAFVSNPVTDILYATSWLRQVYNNATLPTEAANSGNAKIALTFNAPVFSTDTPGAATTLAALYTSGVVTSTAKGGITVTNGSGLPYPKGVGAWITPPGERIGSGQAFTVEFFGGQAFGRGGQPAAGALFTATDSAGTHSVTKTVGSMTLSARQVQTSCTATNGSAVLSSCSDTSRFIVGQRITLNGVNGLPGEPRIISKTSNSLTLGSLETCVTTLNSGNITVNGTPAHGDALADGGFVGATLSDANITGPVAGVANITTATVTADITQASLKATAAVIHTDATAVTATAAHACTINHIFQGSTGSVTVLVGDPVPVWSATFAAADFTGASFADGVVGFRAQLYPVVGDATAVLDTQLGADGTRCDWFYKNVSGTGGAGVCDSGNAAWFNANGTDISANLHNLWAYLDTAGTYAPKYAWVSGTAGGASAVQATSADPGAAAYYATISAALTALKTAYGGTGANGGVVCVLAAGSPYASMGGDTHLLVLANKPPAVITSVLSGQNCPASGSTGSDVLNVALAHHATLTSNNTPSMARFNNLKFADSNTIVRGQDTTLTTTFNTFGQVFNDDYFVPTNTIFSQAGINWISGGLVDEAGGEGRVLLPASNLTAAPTLIFGSTLICGTYVAKIGALNLYNAIGNIAWGCTPQAPQPQDNVNYVPQPLSIVSAYNRWMGQFSSNNNPGAIQNLLMANEVLECINTNTSPCLQISGDSANLPTDNIWRTYTSVVGARTNDEYHEGVPIKGIAVASGGTFAAGTYFIQVTYALKGNPTVETATDSIFTNASNTVSGTVVVLNGSMTVDLPCDPNYVAYIYVGLIGDITNAGFTNQFLGHYATVAAADAKQLAMCQTVTVTGQGSAHNAITLAATTSHGYLKRNFYELFNIDQNYNMKGDWYGTTTGQSGGFGGGGKVGNLGGRFRPYHIGNVAVSGSAVGVGYGVANGLGEFPGYLETYNSNNLETDISWVKYKSDRSSGSTAMTTTVPQTPAINLGMGHYCLDTSVTHPLSLVPSGFASWPWDVMGRTRLNDGTGAAGAYERGCT